jgi:hypothetical protein
MAEKRHSDFGLVLGSVRITDEVSLFHLSFMGSVSGTCTLQDMMLISNNST